MENGKITIELDADLLLESVQTRLSNSPRLRQLITEAIESEMESGTMEKMVRSCTKKAMKDLIPIIVRDMVDDDDDFYRLVKAKVIESVKKGFRL